jgi:deoxyadenosine/deoxycytidine kinase
MHYLVIEGNIGAGKTSLATLLAHELNAKLILEQFADNPFLPKFYKNPERYSFPLELSFLAERYSSLTANTNGLPIPFANHYRLLFYEIVNFCSKHPRWR